MLSAISLLYILELRNNKIPYKVLFKLLWASSFFFNKSNSIPVLFSNSFCICVLAFISCLLIVGTIANEFCKMWISLIVTVCVFDSFLIFTGSKLNVEIRAG